MKGKLFVVATPIGNLEDITLRAISTLKKSSFILCEDTRVSAVLMKKYEILTPLISYRDQNHDRMMSKILEKLNMGLNLSLISDAGTPTISDPGYKLVKDLKEKGFDVIAIPGPDATTAALSCSGLPTDRYIFLGFLPKSESNRKKILKQYSESNATISIYESPNRVFKLLTEIEEVMGDRIVCLANDITKMFELVETDSVSNLLKKYEGKSFKGEYVVLIGKE